jgi:general secretion pathway protein G
MKTKTLKHRFSLIELLVVIAIIMVLAGIGIGVNSLVSRKMRDSACKAMISKMSIALESYRAKTGYYIQAATTVTGFYIDKYTTADDLNDFIDIPDSQILDKGDHRKNGSNVGGSAWLDPWGNEFRYQCPGVHNPMSFDLYSRGADALGPKANETSADDITNWHQ